MSLGQKAVILLRLDASRGQCVSVADLAGHLGLYGVTVQLVEQHILALEAEGYALAQRDPHGAVIGAHLTASAVAVLNGDCRAQRPARGGRTTAQPSTYAHT